MEERALSLPPPRRSVPRELFIYHRHPDLHWTRCSKGWLPRMVHIQLPGLARLWCSGCEFHGCAGIGHAGGAPLRAAGEWRVQVHAQGHWIQL